MSEAGVSVPTLRIACTSPLRIALELGDRWPWRQAVVFLPGRGDLDVLIDRDQRRARPCSGWVETMPEAGYFDLKNAVFAALCARGWRAALDA